MTKTRSMRLQSIFAIVTLAAMVISSANCKGDQLGPLKDQVLKLVTEHSGVLSSLKDKLAPMLAKVDLIPDSIPGASALKSAFGDNNAVLGKLQGLLSSAPEKAAAAIADGKKADIVGLLADVKDAGTQLQAVSSFVAESAPKIAELEALAASASDGPKLDYAKTLSTGYELQGTATGIENALVTFLDDDSTKPDKETWFNFDRLTFATGSADLEMEKSSAQLQNIAEILKAYPKAKVKLGGYTDNTGDKGANMKISQARADNVMKALVDLGVSADRLDAEGYGPAHPVCAANDTPECQEQNRRIALRATAK